ncbi:hypothetical protein IKZ77_00030, partial [Candidatus Saccharibacteria bacterium]|nr:hypothetical protein [Candidatus Saccharibacteria bacterium]
NCNNKCSKLERVQYDSGYYFVIRDADLYSESFREMGSFTLVYPGVATLSDGTPKDLKIIFNKYTIITSSRAPSSYKEDVRMFRVSNSDLLPDFAPLVDGVPGEKYHIGVRADVKIRIDDIVGEDESATKVSNTDTLLVTARHLNVTRGSNTNFAKIASAETNYYYSESAMPDFSTLSPESDLYVAGSHLDEVTGSFDGFIEDSYSNNDNQPYRLVAVSGVGEGYEGGFAGVGMAHTDGNGGTVMRIWSSTGINDRPLDLYLMPGGIEYTSKSSSGENGKIELWTSGVIDDSVAELDGGNTTTPRTYVVPNGKEVTYKMTPDSGYILDTLLVNGVEVSAVPVIENDEVSYYTYVFDGSIIDAQEIKVSWKKVSSDEVGSPDTGMNSELVGGGASDGASTLILCMASGTVMALVDLVYRKYLSRRID